MRTFFSRMSDFLREILQTGLRLFPWSAEPGLRAVGNPGPFSPVLITGNYDLTVRRVLRAIEDLDAWLVVAPSGGINVWCAAAGGHLTTHQVVTALKTSGIESKVQHKRAILPQLAATGVMARDVMHRCRWRVRFGPVYARDLPRYLADGEKKTDAMRHVRFGVKERLEAVVMWAVPSAFVLGGASLLLRPAWSLPLITLSSALALALFFLYDRIPGPRRLIFGACGTALALGAVWLAGGGGAAYLGTAGAAIALTAVLTFDYPGATPIEGSAFFEQRRWTIALDPDRCKGVYSCWEVCPEACYEKVPGERKIDLAHDDRCVRCGACVVQCPMDALFFEDQDGERIAPDVIRRYKLNMLGRRTVDAGEPAVGTSSESP